MQGLITALITPFDSNDKIDQKGLRQLIERQIPHVDGIVLLGTTGEPPTLSEAEKRLVIEIGIDAAKGKIPVYIGTGSYSTAQTIENTKLAKELGADGALVATPYYNKPTQEGLFRHFQALTHAVDLPICVYNIPGRTGQNLMPDTLKRIATLPHIVSVKEGSANLSQIDDIIQIFHQHPMKILSADDSLTLPIMALGGHGVISVVSNLIPKPLKEMVDACSKGNYDHARKLHFQLSPFFKGAFIETNPICIKAALQMANLPAGNCRLPLCEMLPDNKSKLNKIVESIPKEWIN